MLRLGDNGTLDEVAARWGLIPFWWKAAKQPYFIRLPDGKPIAFAGLMSRRNIEGDKAEFTCAIMTRDAVGLAAEIHTRMPVGCEFVV